MIFKRLLHTLSPFEDSKRYTFIEGLRGIAVLMVFMVHFLGQYHSNNYHLSSGSVLVYLAKFFHSGHIGVDCFFILSGFLIYQALAVSKRKTNFWRFITKRYIRLLPIIIVIVILRAIAHLNSIKLLIDNIFFLRLFPTFPYINFVTWSLTYEVYFYIIAGIWFIILPNRISKSWWFIIAMFLLILISPFFFKTLQIAQPTRFLGFVWGIGLGKLLEQGLANNNTFRKNNLLLFLVGLFMIVLLMFGWNNFGWAQNVSVSLISETLFYLSVQIGFILIVACCFNNSKSKRANFLSAYWLRYLGTISYSFYMVHCMCLELSKNIFSRYFDVVPFMILQFFSSLFLTILLSHFLFYYLEKPYFENSKIKQL